MSQKLRIRAGTLVHMSELGHNNFFYPSETTREVVQECEAEVLLWVGSNDMKPVKVKTKAIFPEIDDDGNVVVWVMNELIKKGAHRLRQGNKEE